MIGRRATPRRGASSWLIAPLVAVVLASGCAANSPAPVTATTVVTPQATSIRASGGTWVTVAMGQLDQPLNTFWQLFYRPTGSTRWSNQVEATAVATNGGIALAPAGGNTVMVGVVPTDLLTFTPIIASGDGGRSWQDGLIDAGLAKTPDSLASDGAGRTLALTGDNTSGKVLLSAHDLSIWQTVIAEAQLAATPAGRRCGLTALTAVTYAGTTPVVAGNCSNPGVSGVFALRSGSWQAAGPPTAPTSPVQVLGLRTNAGVTTGLFATTSAADAGHLTAAWTIDGGQHWTESPSLPLAGSQRITSFGPADGSGVFVLIANPDGINRVYTITAPGRTWSQLPPPPAGTATLAVTTPGQPQALAVHNTELTVWALAPGSHQWTKTQTIPVNIQYGSSS
jgi:hypothetical protein